MSIYLFPVGPEGRHSLADIGVVYNERQRKDYMLTRI